MRNIASFLVGVFFVLVLTSQLEAESIPPQEPEINVNTSFTWEVQRDRTAILTFPESSDNVEFRHSIKYVPQPMPECNSVRRRGNELLLRTRSETPYLYTLGHEPIAWRFKNTIEWSSLVGRTSGWIK